ncbi:unnamed protein product [Rotaria sp. Silwood2]|nr:unnamed protein product [Rotaria sp. Silwood2]CAF4060485.1 unnamed protein product [Rotaria sp. Silwood2]
MQIVFLQDDNDDLRKAMETTININAICAMSCFENQDFEGLKVAMRKMPNSQASYGWDMEAFDMLVTVETLKGNREVPLLPGQKFAPVQHSVRALNSILLYSQSSFNNQIKYIIDN